jgi:lipopolysaccharide cholinephosphotransferase
MTRENYEKFLVSASKGLGKKYFIQAIETEPDCPYPYCKVQDNTGSMFVEYSNHRLDIHRGVFIDVLPFDEVPDDFEAYTKQYKTMRRLFRMFMLNTMPDIGYPPKGLISLCKNTIRKIVHLICRLVFIKDKLYWQMKREMTRYNGTGQKAISCLFFPQIKKDYIEKTNLYPLLSHRFEQAEFPVPNNLDTYLTTHYGDYMQLPPPEKRYGHRPYQVSLKCTDRCNKKILGEI